MRSTKFQEQKYFKASPKEKREMLETIRGIGNLNYSHLSRVLDYATGCGVEAIQIPQEPPIKNPKKQHKNTHAHTVTGWAGLAGVARLNELGGATFQLQYAPEASWRWILTAHNRFFKWDRQRAPRSTRELQKAPRSDREHQGAPWNARQRQETPGAPGSARERQRRQRPPESARERQGAPGSTRKHLGAQGNARMRQGGEQSAKLP